MDGREVGLKAGREDGRMGENEGARKGEVTSTCMYMQL